MFNIGDLPCVRAQLERDIAAAQVQQPAKPPAAEEYARAPVAGGTPVTPRATR